MVPLKACIKSEQNYLSILGKNRNMHDYHSVPHSNGLLRNTIYNNVDKENTCYESYN